MRLTNGIRDDIIIAAMRRTDIKERMTAIILEGGQLALDMRSEGFGGPEAAQKVDSTVDTIRKLINKLPKGLKEEASYRQLWEEDTVLINAGGLREHLRYDGTWFLWAYGHGDLRTIIKDVMEEALFDIGDPNFNYPSCEVTVDARHPLAVRFCALENKKTEFNDRMLELYQEIKTLLASVSSSSKLLEVWPEAEELLPEKSVKLPSTLPVVQVQALNDALGLPTEKATA